MSKRKTFFLLLTVVGLFYNTLQGDFLNYDDNWLIDQKIIKSPLSLKNIAAIFTFGNRPHYSPIRDLSYKLDYIFYKNNPFGYHLTNLLIYLITVILVYKIYDFILSPLISKRSIWFWTTIFAIHPIHSEVVAWLAERKGLLAGLFIFSSFYCFILFFDGTKKRVFYFLSILLFIMGLLSKPSALSFPLIIFLYIFLFREQQINFKKTISLTAPYVLPAIPALIINLLYFKNYIQNYSFKYYFQMGQALWQYLFNFLVPIKLAPIYGFRKELLPFLICIFSLIIFLLSLSCIIKITLSDKNKKLIIFSIGWIIISFLPHSNIIPNNIIHADRYFYLPSFGAILLIPLLIHGIKSKLFHNKIFSTKTGQAIRLFTSISTILLLLILVYRQNAIWKDDFSLWNYNIKIQPESYYAQLSIGNVYTNNKQYSKALQHYLKALELNPESAKTYHAIGFLFYKLTKYDKAVEFYKKSLEYDQHNVDIYNKLIAAYGKQKLYFKALSIYNKAKVKGLSSKNIEENFVLLQKLILQQKTK